MPIVTNGLRDYFHSRDGVKSGGVLNNIAPGGPAKNMSIIGGGQIADGSIRLDAIDDYMTVPMVGAPYENYGAAYTFELVYTPRSTVNFHEIIDAGLYFMKASGTDTYYEYAHSATPHTEGSHGLVSQFSSFVPMCLTFAYEGQGTQNNLRFYVNGVLRGTVNLRTAHSISAFGYNQLTLFRGLYATKVNADVWATRYYTRELSAAEITQNWNEGTQIGLSLPKVKIAELRIGAGDVVPIYSITNHENQPLRINTANGIGFIELVLVTDPNASRIRMQTPAGLRALKK